LDDMDVLTALMRHSSPSELTEYVKCC
jgi:hypothetical protein